MAQSTWFKRARAECESMSPYIRFKRIRMGFWRVFFKNSYLHECTEDMKVKGYDIIEPNPRLERREFFQEYEDNIDAIMHVKNYREGYHDFMDHIRTRVFLHKSDKEFSANAEKAYSQFVVK